ncbi:MAG: DUF2066 domain-containing protein [Gammaproteobacteria bacterium]|nr:DUF2066 domain-containing protein [Gammaproteobacteria bacterium]NNJ83544.1 DUF2066 domain-containing protein [Gammaproteobacteria bacterium]
MTDLINQPVRQSYSPSFAFASLVGLFFVGITFMSIADTAHSAQANGLYEARVAVSDKSDQEKALQAALRQVIEKITGQREWSDQTAMDEALEHPDRYVQQFLYRTEAPSGSPESSPPDLIFWARFDVGAIDELLRSANFSVRGGTKPSVLIWLVLKGETEDILLGANNHGELSGALYDEAAKRGIPIMLPLLDLDDLSRIDGSDVWDGSRERILAASERYAADAVLVGQVSGTSTTRWEAYWSFLEGASISDNRWRTSANEPDEVLRRGINEAIDFLVDRTGGAGGENIADMAFSQVRLTVSGIDTIADYARTLRYLEGLDSETKVYVTQATQNRLSFRLSMSGSETEFARMVDAGKTLTGTMSTDGEFAFRLLP